MFQGAPGRAGPEGLQGQRSEIRWWLCPCCHPRREVLGAEQLEPTKSWNGHGGWKSPLRSPSPALNPALPTPSPNTVCEHWIHFWGQFQGWHLPGQPMPEHPFRAGISPKIQPDPSLGLFGAVSFRPINQSPTSPSSTLLPGWEFNAHPTLPKIPEHSLLGQWEELTGTGGSQARK